MAMVGSTVARVRTQLAAAVAAYGSTGARVPSEMATAAAANGWQRGLSTNEISLEEKMRAIARTEISRMLPGVGEMNNPELISKIRQIVRLEIPTEKPSETASLLLENAAAKRRLDLQRKVDAHQMACEMKISGVVLKNNKTADQLMVTVSSFASECNEKAKAAQHTADLITAQHAHFKSSIGAPTGLISLWYRFKGSGK